MTLYIYAKILNILPVSKIKAVSAIIFSFLMSIPITYVSYFEIVFLGSCCLYLGITTRVKPSLLFTAVFIATGISLGIEILAYTVIKGIVVTAGLVLQAFNFLPQIFSNNITLWDALQEGIIVILSLFIARFFFHLKRSKNGFVFLESKEAVWIGVIFSIIIMLARSFLNEEILILVSINICTIGLYLWWQYHTTVLYLQRISRRDLENCLLEIKEKEIEIEKLNHSNTVLSKAVHRDNKLIPALYNAVEQYIADAAGNMDSEMRGKGETILLELSEIMEERKEELMQIHREQKTIPSTGMKRVDYLLKHMQQKAKHENIVFDIVIAGGIKDTVEKVISKQNIEVLLADLIDNAIIAVSYSTYKKILLTLAVVENNFEISIQDSGIPFEIETLAHLGKQKATTHRDTGGSGIGYMSIFEILKESNASIVISEHSPDNNSFSKSITVCFDEKSEYRIASYRSRAIQRSIKSKDIIIE